MNKLNKKGVLGLDTVRDVMLAFLVVAVIAVTVIIMMFTLQGQDATRISRTLTIENETISTLNSTTNNTFAVGLVAGNEDCVGTIVAARVYNNTAGPTHEVVPASNYTVSECNIILVGSPVTIYNQSDFNVSYTAAYRTNTTDNIGKNLSASTSDFFSNTSTIFAILVVVVIILAIAIIIAVVSRFGGGGRGLTSGKGRTGGSAGRGTVMGI